MKSIPRLTKNPEEISASVAICYCLKIQPVEATTKVRINAFVGDNSQIIAVAV